MSPHFIGTHVSITGLQNWRPDSRLTVSELKPLFIRSFNSWFAFGKEWHLKRKIWSNLFCVCVQISPSIVWFSLTNTCPQHLYDSVCEYLPIHQILNHINSRITHPLDGKHQKPFESHSTARHQNTRICEKQTTSAVQQMLSLFKLIEKFIIKNQLWNWV